MTNTDITGIRGARGRPRHFPFGALLRRMSDPAVLAVKKRVTLIPDGALMDPKAPRSGKVEAVLKDGRAVEHFTPHAYGTKENPMDTVSVNAKVRDLIEPVLGAERTAALIQRVNELERVSSVRELMPFLTVDPREMAQARFWH